MEKPVNIDGKRIRVKDKVFTWSNLISVSRALVALPIVYLHYHNGQQVSGLIIALVIYGVVSDYLDGMVARWTDEISELGKSLDPVADKLAAFILFLYTVWIGRIPFWFFIFGVIRDVLIMTGSGYIRLKRGKVPMSVMSGKISVNVLALYWLIAFFFPQAGTALMILKWCSVAFMIYSFIDYVHRFNQIRKGAEFN